MSDLFLPLLDVDEVRAEIAETDRELAEMLEVRVVDREQWAALRERKLARRRKLAVQLEAMERAA